jgi:glycosyltransferase involved in cell wall biosynthesis
MGFYSFYIVLFTDRAIQGWASTIIPIYFLGGIQLLSIGIIGEYIGKIYKEVKNRPRYLVEETI